MYALPRGNETDTSRTPSVASVQMTPGKSIDCARVNKTLPVPLAQHVLATLHNNRIGEKSRE